MKKLFIFTFIILIFISCCFTINAVTYHSVYFYSQGNVWKLEQVRDGDTLDLTAYGTYKSEYIPNRPAYVFSYWYELDRPLTPVYQITPNSQTRLYAKWTSADYTVTLNFPNECYWDVDGYNAIPRNLQYEQIKNITFYYDSTYDNRSGYTFQKTMNVTSADGNFVIVGEETSIQGVYKFSYDVGIVGASFSPNWFRNPTIQLVIYPQTWGTFSDIKLDGVSWNGNPKVVSASEHTLTFNVYPPMVIANGQFMWSLDGDTDGFYIKTEVIETNSSYGFYTKVTCKYTTLKNGAFYFIIRSISEYDSTSYQPVIVYDENSNASWAFSEVELLDTNWSDVNDNLPHKLNGLLDGLYGLSGLAILVPLVMMVSFAIWFVRRS